MTCNGGGQGGFAGGQAVYVTIKVLNNEGRDENHLVAIGKEDGISYIGVSPYRPTIQHDNPIFRRPHHGSRICHSQATA